MEFIKRLKDWQLLLILVIATIVIYYPSFYYPFLDFDDNLYIYSNPYVVNFDWDKLKPIFINYRFGHYFPLTLVSYGLQNNLHGLNGGYFHILNVALHLINIALVFTLIKRLDFSSIKAFFAAGLFACNPIQVESVAWVGTRGGILSTLFVLLGFIYYIKYLKSNKLNLILSVYCFFILAVFSKSSATVFPIFLFLFDYFFKRKLSWGLLIEKVPALFISLIIAIIALIAASELGTVSKGLEVINWADQIWVIGYSISFYLLRPIWPVHLANMHFDTYVLYKTIPLNYILWSIIFIVSVVVLFFVSKNKRLFFFSLGFFLTNIFLIINILPIGGTVVSERYAYLTILSIPFFVFSFPKFRIKPELVFYIVLLIIIIFSVMSSNRLKVWSSSKILFEDLTEKYPDYSYGFYGLGNYYLHNEEYQKALKLFNKAIKIDPKKEYYLNRGVTQYRLEKFDSALIDLNIHVIIAPGASESYTNRGLVKFELGDLEGALQDYDLAIKLDSNDPKSYFNRAHLRLQLFDEDGGCKDLHKSYKKGYSDAKVFYDKFCAFYDDLASKTGLTQKGEKIFYKNGKVKFEIKNQVIENDSGAWLIYYDSLGQVKEEGVVKRGKYFGAVRWYFPDGKIRVKGAYKNIIPYGNWLEYYSNGNLLASYQYKNGLKEGEEVYYHSSRKIWTKRTYEKGKLHNVQLVKDKNGVTLNVGTFKNGNGILNVYNEDGELIKKVSYLNGKRKN